MFNFPDAPTEGQIFSPPGGPAYKFTSPVWKAFFPDADAPLSVPEAPTDGQVYGRLNSTWVVLASGTGDMTPPGTVIWSACTTAPVGYLKANGASLLRADYPNLFAAIGTTYGAADGTHFNVPDLRGEFPRGFDDGRGVDAGRVQGVAQAANIESHTHAFTGTAMGTHNHNATSGTESVDHTHTFSDSSSATGNASANHTHTAYPGDNRTPTSNAAGSALGTTGTLVNTGSSGASHTHTVAVSGTTSGRSAAHTHTITVVAISAGTPAGTNSAYGTGTDTRPRNVALLACIKF
jgi:microcystin-dependent protein